MDNDIETLHAGSGYKFSAMKISALGATEYTLATIVMDASGSVEPFKDQLETALKTIYKACDKSPRRDNLMLRVTQFAHNLKEHHGFKLLGNIKEADYDGVLSLGGQTALFDAAQEAVESTSTYGKQLTKQDFLVNAIIVVVTDGDDNASRTSVSSIKQALKAARQAENLESITCILVGVTNDNANLNHYLQTFKDDAGMDQYVSIGSATPGKIAKLAAFVSQSISSTSSALGTGQSSKPLVPTF
jgi:hypothetical protein